MGSLEIVVQIAADVDAPKPVFLFVSTAGVVVINYGFLTCLRKACVTKLTVKQ